mmetsp:Transcript_51795/g.165801  ORF Transcript_51795/g.165801 Transcript_51795/m.165801 type:complete len:260 (-) Transcript_51795:650-1429(-)
MTHSVVPKTEQISSKRASRRPERNASILSEACRVKSATSSGSSGPSAFSCSRSCTPKRKDAGAAGRSKSNFSMSSRETLWPRRSFPATTSAGLAAAARLPRLAGLEVEERLEGAEEAEVELAAGWARGVKGLAAGVASLVRRSSPSSRSLLMSSGLSCCMRSSCTISSGSCASEWPSMWATSRSRSGETPKESASALTTASQPLRPSPPVLLESGCSSWMLYSSLAPSKRAGVPTTTMTSGQAQVVRAKRAAARLPCFG